MYILQVFVFHHSIFEGIYNENMKTVGIQKKKITEKMKISIDNIFLCPDGLV